MPSEPSHDLTRRGLLGSLAVTSLAGCLFLSNEDEAGFTSGPASWSPGAGDVPAESWPMARHDAGQSGAAPRNTGPEPPLAHSWTAATDVGSFYPPVVADGRVLACHRGGILVALDAATGEQLWRFETDQFFWGSPAVADGTVYVHESLYLGDDRPDVISAFDAATGNREWTYEPKSARGSDVVVADGTVYVTCAERLLAVDATTGELAWAFRAGEPHRRLASVALGGDTVYVTAHTDNLGIEDDPEPVSGTVFALDPVDETVRWSVNGVLPTEVATAGETVLVRDFDDPEDGLPVHTLFTFDRDTGDQRWQAELRGHHLEWVSTGPHIAVADGTVYHQTTAGEEGTAAISAVSLADGTDQTRYDLGHSRSHARTPIPSIAGERLYAVTSRARDDHWVDVFDLATKTRLATTEVHSPHVGSKRAGAPVVADETLFVGGHGDGVLAFR